MMSNEPMECEGIVDHINKFLTIFLFLFLPRRVSTKFVELSIGILLLRVRGLSVTDPAYLERLNSLFGNDYDSSFLELPYRTVKWFWTDSYLNSYMYLNTGRHTVREILSSNKLLSSNTSVVIQKLLENLPVVVRYKLGLSTSKGLWNIRYRLVELFRKKVIMDSANFV